MASPIPPTPCLHDRGHADPECHAANGLAGQGDGVLAVVSGQSAAETAHRQRRRFTPCIHQRRDDDGEQKLKQQESEAAGLRNQPFGDVVGIGHELGEQT
jgi:hypothetical protein